MGTQDESLIAELLASHSRFSGDLEDLAEFTRLVESPIHSDERGRALDRWRGYNRVERLPPGAVRPDGMVVKVAMWQEYLKPRGVHLEGADFPWAFLGTVDLDGAHLVGCNLHGARFKRGRLNGADLTNADLGESLLIDAQLRNGVLVGTELQDSNAPGVDFGGANLAGADLSGANLAGANFAGANLSGADLADADLTRANLVGADLSASILDRALVYGIAAWDVVGEPASSVDLRITHEGPGVTVDNVKVAQFLYLLLHNPEIRETLDTITRKVVLILGNFKPSRKQILDHLKPLLRQHNYVPIVFDFQKPEGQDLMHTITLLARLARFIIADVSQPRSVPAELTAIVPDVAVPMGLIVAAGEEPYAMLSTLLKYPWVLGRPLEYEDAAGLELIIERDIITPAEAKATELQAAADR